MDLDLRVRMAAFEWLSDQVALHGDVLPRGLLAQGFDFEGNRIPLVAPQGIFKPRILELPISITTSPDGPYRDSIGKFLEYKYRGTDPNHRDNIGMRKMLELQRPLIYFFGLVPGQYMASWPVYIIADDPSTLTFTVAVDDIATAELQPSTILQVSDDVTARRSYVTATVKVRLHQRSFRERVLDAYSSQCSFCRLKHRELLDAAHIVPDNLAEGEPIITNGIALCKLHHSAYDSFILGVSPDYIIRVRGDILEEEDGPVLQHGLKGLHNSKLFLPSAKNHWPNKELLAWRYDKFSRAG
jgi:putative restriction endonuclease